MRAAEIIGCAAAGAIVGSFLNVVIYRVPRGQSIVSPPSACPSCGNPIARRDNVPVISYLRLGGRCRSCEAPISARYPAIEILCSALFAGAAAREQFNGDLISVLIFFAGLLALAVIDLEHLKLPKGVVYVTLAGVSGALFIQAAATGQWRRLLIAAACGASWFALFYLLNAVSPKYLGFGDVRLAPLLGLELGWFGVGYVLLGFFSANLIGAVIGLTLIATKTIRRDQPVPYGVFLALGSALALFAGPELLAPFHQL